MIAYVLAAILALSPRLATEPGRAQRYAADIASASQGDLDLALALVVTANGESSFLRSRETCVSTGDGGHSVSLYQLNRWSGSWGTATRRQLCDSNLLATQRAAYWLIMLRLRTGGWRGAIRAYVGCDASDERVAPRISNFRRLKSML